MKKLLMLSSGILLGTLAGGALVKKIWLEKYRKQKAILALAERERDLLYTWFLLEQKGADLADYFREHGYENMAVLGMNREGRRLIDALNGNFPVVCGIELDVPGAIHEALTVYRLGDDPLPSVDCVVICDFERVPEKILALQKEYGGPVVTLTQVLAWCLEKHQIQPRDGAIENWPPENEL